MASLDFDPNAKPQEIFDPLPPGKYAAMVVEADVKNARTGNGQYLWLKWQITDGEYQGRYVFGNITMRNTNQKAQEIGARAFASLKLALGLQQVADSAELVNGQCVLDLKIKPADDQYNASNEIKGYLSFEAAAAPANAPAAATTPAPVQQQATGRPPTAPAAARTAPAPATAAVGGGASPPWRRK